MPFVNGKLRAPNAVLVDRRNWAQLKDVLIAEMAEAKLCGFDIETHDDHRHEGLNRLMKVDPEGYKSGSTKLLFDINRTVVTGFSWAPKGSPRSYYLNLAHADVENRLHFWEDGVHLLLDAKSKEAWWTSHNAPYELAFMDKGWGPDLSYRMNYKLGDKIICTLQMAVTAFNEDSYPVEKFMGPDLGNIPRVFPEVNRLFHGWDRSQELSKEQEEVLYKVISKESKAEHSYNGYVKTIRYGYGLKALSKSIFNYDQTSFETVLGGKPHMGALTGEEVFAYGCDDAWVCLDIYEWLLEFMMKNNPAAVGTFFTQENPMVHVFSDVRKGGVRINVDKVRQRKQEERDGIADTLMGMKHAIRTLLPFPEEVHDKMVKYDPKYYGKTVDGELVTAHKYRKQVADWAKSQDLPDPFQEAMKAKLSLTVQWTAELGLPEKKTGISLEYYQVVRCILLDLCRLSFQLSEGKIQSDADAVDRMRQRHVNKGVKEYGMLRLIKSKEEADAARETGMLVEDDAGNKYVPGPKARDESGALNDEWWKFKAKLDVVDYYGKIKGTNQAFKLYLGPYENLTDPETGKVYPVLSSQLNSRRMALESPNLSQLAKFKDMGYVRQFFEPDDDDEEEHVMISADWSAVELVLIGDQSGDANFAWAYSQIPHKDLHSITCASLLNQSLEEFRMRDKGEQKQLRTELGKPANFGYWYSGGLGTVAKELGWSSETMWDYVEKYRHQFAGAEQWRLETIEKAKTDGCVQLPDGLMRYRMESTAFWAEMMRQKFYSHGEAVGKFGDLCIKKISRRSGNQAVNSMIQGTGGTLAKRSLLRMINIEIPKHGFHARHLFPVHDELVFSVRRSEAVAFAKVLVQAMSEHPTIVKNLKLDVAVAVGLNYWAWNDKKNPVGQVELDEASKVPCLPEDRWGQKLTDEERQKVVDYLFTVETA